MGLRILLVEDEPSLLLALGEALAEAGHDVVRCPTGDKGARALATGGFDLLVSDMRLPGTGGAELARLARERRPPVPVVLMTAYGDVSEAVTLMRQGAADYLLKPFREEVLLRRIETLERAIAPQGTEAAAGPVAASSAMREVLRVARLAAGSDTTVLVTGETGAGKEVVARYVHDQSSRRHGTFLAANCAAIPGELLESELFGHERGAFTGAREARQGWIRAAQGGTLLLDEVGELSPPAQARLLRAIEERKVLPVGSDRAVPVDVRIIAATHRDLEGEVERGRFREDLLYRLNAFELRVPPLRERPEDVLALARSFLAAKGHGGKGLSEEVAALLVAHRWAGNVRELRNTLDYALILAGNGVIEVSHLPRRFLAQVPTERPLGIRESVDRVEVDQIRRALAVTEGHRQRAADLLGISRKNLWELMRRHGMDDDGA